MSLPNDTVTCINYINGRKKWHGEKGKGNLLFFCFYIIFISKGFSINMLREEREKGM